MCGRYVTRTDAAIERYWSIVEPWTRHVELFNVAPSQEVPVVVPRAAGRLGAFMRWGLNPHWAGGEPTRYPTINARVETIATAVSYRGPWRRGQRCTFPVLGFYEWKAEPDGKQPYFIRLSGGEPFGPAGLWDRSAKPDSEAVESCTIITVTANPLVGFHPRDAANAGHCHCRDGASLARRHVRRCARRAAAIPGRRDGRVPVQSPREPTTPRWPRTA